MFGSVLWNESCVFGGAEGDGDAAGAFAAFCVDGIGQASGDAVKPFGARFAGHDPKAARGNVDRDAVARVGFGEIENHIGTETDAGDGWAEGGVIAVRANSE